MLSFSAPPPLALYIHLPWCAKKCPYCDFNSYAHGEQAMPEAAYIDALLADLKFSVPQIQGRFIGSIFIGGGTPSLFSAAALRRLLTTVFSYCAVVDDVEITMEANPGTVTEAQCCAWQSIGINRLSIGAQSFSDASLQALGRIHNGQTAINAVQAAQAAGLYNLNVDLMFGLPEHTLAEAQQDLEQAVALAPQHISYYQLTLEPNTYFYRYPPALPNEDIIWEMQCAGQDILARHGYQQYEISAYARSGTSCRHNLNYWQFGDYLGLGAGAHSKLTDWHAGVIYRMARHRLPERYMELAGGRAVLSGNRALSTAEIPLEFMMNALRLTAGLAESIYTAHTGLSLADIADPLRQARQRGWLGETPELLCASTLGQRYLNDVLQCFMPA